MTVVGIIIGVAIVAGLLIAMGKMSEQGVDINTHFCCGHCNTCDSQVKGEECSQYDDLKKLHLNAKNS